MKRRKALLGISLLAGGALISYTGLKWLRFNSAPEFKSLVGNKKLIASLADTIIPKSHSPSASECGVHEFIIKMVMEATDVRTQNKFVSGLAAVEEYSSSQFGNSFVDCSIKEQNQIVAYFSSKEKPYRGIVGKIQKKLLGKPFFDTLREYTVVGYFTSEQGATTALRYSHIPSKYKACQPYTQGEKAWSTF
jgi:hypothetical protein